MSSFDGLVKEIPGISVDRFHGDNLKSRAYFLSHCHADHMRGLDHNFLAHLQLRDKYIYCSPISRIFLRAKYSANSDRIRDIPINEKILVKYKHEGHDSYVFVTCISSGHCPGSVMFLFEKSNSELILYTGDFRINPLDYQKIAPLHKGREKVRKQITAVYLDTTFFNPDFAHLPTRKESMDVMCKTVRQWLDKNSKNVIVLECSATYGSEFLYMGLSTSSNMRVHVKDLAYESYCRISDLAPHVTNDALSARIHACVSKKDRSVGLTCRRDISRENILTIVPSVMKWKGRDTRAIGEWDDARENTFDVCYSTHASLDELEAFLRYFEPKVLHPCVIPVGCVSFEFPSRAMDKITSKIEKGKVEKEKNREKYTLRIPNDEDDAVEPWTKYYFTNSDDDS